jgi:hypothetical protein
MTLTTLVIVNAVLAAVVVYAIVSLLAFGIHRDRSSLVVLRRAPAQPSANEGDRIAA